MAQSLTCDIKTGSRWHSREPRSDSIVVTEARYERARWHIFFRRLDEMGIPVGEVERLLRKHFLSTYEQDQQQERVPGEVKCEVKACPRFFRPGVNGANGRCARCEMRRRRRKPDVTEAEAREAEARAAGTLSAKATRLVGYVRPELAELVRAAVAAQRFESESDIVNQAVATILGRKDLA